MMWLGVQVNFLSDSYSNRHKDYLSISCCGNFSELYVKLFSFGLWGSRNSFWRRQWHPTPVLLPGKSHGWRSLVGCSPWGCWELGTTERLHFHFSLSCIGEGNGNPLQCSCLENPRDRGAWWAALYGVAQSRTQLRRLSSSSRNSLRFQWFQVQRMGENWKS